MEGGNGERMGRRVGKGGKARERKEGRKKGNGGSKRKGRKRRVEKGEK